MNSILAFIVKSFISVPTTVTVWLISFFALNQTFLLSSGYALLGGGIAYFGTSVIMKQAFLRKHGLTRKEYQYIERNLKEARKKLARLNKSLFTVRHIPSLKQRVDLHRVTKKIYRLSKSEPKRFYKAERFFFSHLDSVVELTEKYAFLSSQPKRNSELERSLHETRRVLEELTHTIEKDLHRMLSNDIEDLHFEIDVAKNSNKQAQDTAFIDQNRR
ncbi:5-bromo-4-chloroindolyl phosphate hydrolysis family protein [Bacillus sinesaloumensis]|uniref:5-bromo-4-chloroindolyl phosphate hydrolysis family protein n=1 Tax=Litchfieldia sinesaloumensis TaxID=1926280 RepID=UPI0009884E25|nr:5-bromo-4-chloroindolyl phosphate hydrolysis family protein [Bacillus sinesaloumensis]